MSGIDKLEYSLGKALDRIDRLERKVEAMRRNINANFDGHARVLATVTEQAGIRTKFRFQVGTDVARGY